MANNSFGSFNIDEFDKSAYEYQMELYDKYKELVLWEMRDGNEIQICDMKDSHIQNCINMLRRKPQNGIRIAWIEIFQSEKMRRRKIKIDNIVNNALRS